MSSVLALGEWTYMSGKEKSVKTEFHTIAVQKGWKLKDIGDRWGVTDRQMSRIANNPKQKDIDAVNGLPKAKNK